jgi:hypothetical protein
MIPFNATDTIVNTTTLSSLLSGMPVVIGDMFYICIAGGVALIILILLRMLFDISNDTFYYPSNMKYQPNTKESKTESTKQTEIKYELYK